MTCNHEHVSSPVTVSLCLDTYEVDCCPDEHETMVVCQDCGMFKIISVEEVCEDCCGGDTSIWNNLIDVWQDPLTFSGLIGSSYYWSVYEGWAQYRGINFQIKNNILYFGNPINNFETLLNGNSFDWAGAEVQKVMFNIPIYTESNCSLDYFFSYMELLSDIINLQYLHTNNVSSMNQMFRNCMNLKWLDLSNFDMTNVTAINYMFYNCSELLKIYVGKDLWNTSNITSGNSVFGNCTALVGQNGKTYNSQHIDKTYARIDTSGNPGYLSARMYFYIKGYHYTKPTTPFRTDGARLFIDTSIDGEECTISTGQSWIKYYIKGFVNGNASGYDILYFEGYLHDLSINNWNASYVYLKDINGNIISTDCYFQHFSGNTTTSFYVPSGVVAAGARGYSDVFQNNPNNIAGTYTYTDDFNAEFNFTITAVEYGNLLQLPETTTLKLAHVQQIQENLTSDQNNLVWSLTLSPYLDDSYPTYVYFEGGGLNSGYFTGNQYIVPTLEAHSHVASISYTKSTNTLIITYNDWENGYTIPSIKYYAGDSYSAHLKGIHYFFAKRPS